MTNLRWGDRGGVVDGPMFGGGAGQEAGGWVDGEGAAGSVLAARDGEHGGVVDGVAEDGGGRGDAVAGEGGDFAFVGGDVEKLVSDEAVGVDGDVGGEDAVGGNAEPLDAFFDDPVAGGTDRPDFSPGRLELADQGKEFGEDARLDFGGEVFSGGGAHGGFGKAGVDLDHFAADG